MKNLSKNTSHANIFTEQSSLKKKLKPKKIKQKPWK